MTEKVNDVADLIPLKKTVDFGRFPGQLSSKEGFVDAVRELHLGNLPKVFPYVPDFIKAKKAGMVFNIEYQDSQLTLPAELYDSEIYGQNLALRGPMEEVIIVNERQRILLGLRRNRVVGKDWSENFRKRFKKLELRETKSELRDEDPDKLPKNLSGSKIA